MLSLLPVYTENERIESQLIDNYNNICKGLFNSSNNLPAFISDWYEVNIPGITVLSFSLNKLDTDLLMNGEVSIIESFVLDTNYIIINEETDHITSRYKFSLPSIYYFAGEDGAIYNMTFETSEGNFKTDIFTLDAISGIESFHLIDFDGAFLVDFDNNNLTTI